MTRTGKKNEGFLALLRNDDLRPLQKRLKAKEEAGRKVHVHGEKGPRKTGKKGT